MSILPEVIDNSPEVTDVPPEVISILTKLGSIAEEKLLEYFSKDHGSKVKLGAYTECPVAMFGDKACIVVNAKNGEVVFLTSDTIQSCNYIKKKKRLVGVIIRKYYYYDIKFKDGSESYVRMRKKYRKAMLRHM